MAAISVVQLDNGQKSGNMDIEKERRIYNKLIRRAERYAGIIDIRLRRLEKMNKRFAI